MPSPTAKSARFMALCATVKGRKKAQAECPPMKVAQEFTRENRKARILKGKSRS